MLRLAAPNCLAVIDLFQFRYRQWQRGVALADAPIGHDGGSCSLFPLQTILFANDVLLILITFTTPDLRFRTYREHRCAMFAGCTLRPGSDFS